MITGCGTKAKENNEDITQEDNTINIIDVNSNSRPYAVMINCHNNALPQAGLDKAYIVYEIMVEGGITRMMALFKDADVSKIGSVRSARTQYIDYVYENDAIYVHAGGATDALEQIANEKITDVDVDGVYGMRDKTLNRAWEHTLFTSTDLLTSASSKKSQRTTTDSGNLLTYSASELDLSQYSSAIKASKVSIKYSDYRTSIYTYDSENQNYLRFMNSTANTDLVTNQQYTAKNIIVYSVNYSSYTYNGYSGYQKLSNIGSGEGYYITDGYAVPITWEKTSKTSKTIYKIKETGEQLVVNDGNTYIQIQPKGQSLEITSN
jgi:hypothetical protein